jgi:hypothetical protein
MAFPGFLDLPIYLVHFVQFSTPLWYGPALNIPKTLKKKEREKVGGFGAMTEPYPRPAEK